jgi:hypothetical protein
VRQAAPQFRLKELRVKGVTWRHPIGVIIGKAAISPRRKAISRSEGDDEEVVKVP